jgi:hypothetical protein
MAEALKRGPSRHDLQKKPIRGYSPVSRQAIREEAEAAALAVVDAELEARRRKSDELRRLRLAQVAE